MLYSVMNDLNINTERILSTCSVRFYMNNPGFAVGIGVPDFILTAGRQVFVGLTNTEKLLSSRNVFTVNFETIGANN